MRLLGRASQRPDLLRVWFVGAALFVFTDGPLFYLSQDVLGRSGPSWHDRVVAGGLTASAGIAGLLVLWHLWRTRLASPQPPHPVAAAAVAAFVLVTAASTAWSIDWQATGWRAVVYAGLAMLAWLLADLGDRAWQPLALMAAAGVFASHLVAVFDSGTGIDLNGDWQGIYLSRNLLAPVAAVGVIVGVRLAWRSAVNAKFGSGREIGWALALPSLLAMIYAGSRTAWLALAAGIGLATLPVLHHRLAQRWNARQARATTWAALAATLAAAGALVAVLWDTPTLAQRRTIWQVSWEQFLERPLHGHGFAAIWSWPEFLDNHELLDRGSAHNGALEVLLGLGVLGFVPFAVIVVLAVRNAGRDLLRSPTPDTWMWAAVVAVMLVENTTESFILRFSYNWIIVTAAALRLPKPSTPDPLRGTGRSTRTTDRRAGLSAPHQDG